MQRRQNGSLFLVSTVLPQLLQIAAMLTTFASDALEGPVVAVSLAQKLVCCLLRQKELAFAVAFLGRNLKKEGRYELNAVN